MFKSVIIAATTLVLAGPALAQPAPAAAQPVAGQPVKDPNRMICEREEEIGTRLGARKICRTAAEWDAMRRANREQVDNWQRQNTSTGKPAG
jgi:hypothetical protein